MYRRRSWFVCLVWLWGLTAWDCSCIDAFAPPRLYHHPSTTRWAIQARTGVIPESRIHSTSRRTALSLQDNDSNTNDEIPPTTTDDDEQPASPSIVASNQQQQEEEKEYPLDVPSPILLAVSMISAIAATGTCLQTIEVVKRERKIKWLGERWSKLRLAVLWSLE